jgi:hypothetical protein
VSVVTHRTPAVSARRRSSDPDTTVVATDPPADGRGSGIIHLASDLDHENDLAVFESSPRGICCCALTDMVDF